MSQNIIVANRMRHVVVGNVTLRGGGGVQGFGRET